jgi:multisubunit Na+/H+ antiporter MnhF subunit
MRTKITIGLNVLAWVIGALSLYEGWGHVSTVLLLTAGALALFRMIGVVAGERLPKAIVGFDYVTLTLVCTSLLLEWTRGL